MPPTEAISEIQQYELEISERNWSSVVGKSAASHKLEEEAIELRRLQNSARYGDYAKTIAHRVRGEAKNDQREGWEDVSHGRRSYADLAEKLHKEAKYYDKNGSQSAPGQASSSQAVYAACMPAGIDLH